ncbi:site-specific DNA-methyltransferase [Acinetobacter baumannii]|uniref:site-specific DNA-methyltransferase n=1 Tax=Acinetobacter baumannii TaxID=470 RepID=UPI00280F8DD1|nr:site-specific DNA-methyltransferase [Acinetobacter baumannii]MDQ8919159.1 site-specific DNA-methyltransferase [Acinetobacter baumannii]MDQ8949971.1 site-specific DNA-methyltransferase [Acinetobacter baumannii]MDQ8964139.1 site-specific DNA-methyltransferase [Acinetobacter baumannii]MDQ8967826.1 site-specific DNA-methyltransferase [Acinetobacter baumannii]MDQ8981832.1 site-specific DNA-methyltransferase [Acinetobacter baumannii]
MTKTKLELTWIGKDKRPRLEPRILLEDPSKSYHATSKVSDNDIFDNKLIFGDNLLALKALEREYAGKVKCIFIDPPYNTGNAFSHYDDGLEHSIWLGLIRDRIEIIYNLLSVDGSLWITIDDNEAHYLKVLCDEIFGRQGFITSITWKKRVSPANDAKYFSSDHDYILVYAKSKESWKLNRLERSEDNNSSYKNPDNDIRGPWNSVTYTGNKNKDERPNLYYGIMNPNTNEMVFPPDTLTWRYSLETHKQNEAENLIYWGKDGKSKSPRLKKFLSAADRVVPRSVWEYSDVGSTQTAMSEQKSISTVPFPTPKPERLLERIIHIATNPGDLVLDSFAGSGTTGAVAHKMGRRWIMVELGDHCHTHIIPRLKKVIDGEDKGGVTELTGWQGGGGFRYYKLAPSLMKKDQWENWVINPEYNQEMLVEAICKLEGYTYAPSETEYWSHGRGSETDFIYVTTQTLTDQQLQAISEEVGEGRTLLIIASAWRSKSIDRFLNLTLKKIPNSIIKACEWGHDDYSLNVQNLPMSEPDIEEKPKVKKVKNTQEQSQGTGDLFGDQT